MTDISTMYTKYKNMKTGRKGYSLWKDEKETAIAPAAYGKLNNEWYEHCTKINNAWYELIIKTKELDNGGRRKYQ